MHLPHAPGAFGSELVPRRYESWRARRAKPAPLRKNQPWALLSGASPRSGERCALPWSPLRHGGPLVYAVQATLEVVAQLLDQACD